jgi:hypothetical protein
MEEQVSAQNQNTPLPASNTLLKILALFGIIFMVAGSAYAGYWYGKSKSSSEEALTTPSSATAAPESTKTQVENVKWLEYNNQTYADLHFSYPEGSVITESRVPSQICSDRTDFSLILKYKEMTLTVNRLCGLGGGGFRTFEQKSVITCGNNYDGVGRYVSDDKNISNATYFDIRYGSPDMFNLLTGSFRFSFDFPDSSYVAVADKISCSTAGSLPLTKEVLQKFYYDKVTASLIGVTLVGQEYSIYKLDSSLGENFDTAKISPTGNYLLVGVHDSQMVFNGSALRIYDFASRDFLKIGATEKFPATTYSAWWGKDGSYFIISVPNGNTFSYKKYSIPDLTVTDSSESEYNSLKPVVTPAR